MLAFGEENLGFEGASDLGRRSEQLRPLLHFRNREVVEAGQLIMQARGPATPQPAGICCVGRWRVPSTTRILS